MFEVLDKLGEPDTDEIQVLSVIRRGKPMFGNNYGREEANSSKQDHETAEGDIKPHDDKSLNISERSSETQSDETNADKNKREESHQRTLWSSTESSTSSENDSPGKISSGSSTNHSSERWCHRPRLSWSPRKSISSKKLLDTNLGMERNQRSMPSLGSPAVRNRSLSLTYSGKDSCNDHTEKFATRLKHGVKRSHVDI
ncbi:uncharacterized protein DDB_G0280579-like isoform X2 [Hetaerina americana]|uniref:uncharacterized protein DDB_G0280579-like isoform X2 n=1 Tax=Hetaerina americana TaxID=62018 RepID=UPI003A7F51CC